MWFDTIFERLVTQESSNNLMLACSFYPDIRMEVVTPLVYFSLRLVFFVVDFDF